jgi:hypothetical protein
VLDERLGAAFLRRNAFRLFNQEVHVKRELDALATRFRRDSDQRVERLQLLDGDAAKGVSL